ncbi:MAG: Rrf2 family transcriptional regulator [Phycisphaerae bacterium]|nr:Rrf2 family transcriptional regulator [Phycisphaerae bacterium]
MLAMTKKTGYGLIAMTHLAGLGPGDLASAREIAKEYDVPISLLMNILKELAAGGYVQSVRGARGGYRIARRPEDVNFVELMETLEGPMKFAECVLGRIEDDERAKCKLMSKCPIADPVHRVHRRIRDFLSDLTLADVLHPAAKNAAVKIG